MNKIRCYWGTLSAPRQHLADKHKDHWCPIGVKRGEKVGS